MSYDLGSVVPLSISIYDSDGDLANAGSVSVTITLPDGTTAPSGTVSPTSTGVYDYDYPTVQAGLHGVRWVATGVNAGAFVDIFYVVGAESRQIISLTEAKSQLRMPAAGTSDDDKLMGFVWSATGVVELYVGSVSKRTRTESFDGGRGASVLLSHPPTLSVTQVVESGATLAASDYVLNAPAGVLTRTVSGQRYVWREGVQNVVVTYVAGRTEVEPHWRQAALIIVQHLWETQRPAAQGPFSQASDDYDPRYSYSIPRKALELLGEPVGGIA